MAAGALGLASVLVVGWRGARACVASQGGRRWGSRVGEEFRERAEWVAGVALILVALVLLALRLARVWRRWASRLLAAVTPKSTSLVSTVPAFRPGAVR